MVAGDPGRHGPYALPHATAGTRPALATATIRRLRMAAETARATPRGRSHVVHVTVQWMAPGRTGVAGATAV